MSAGGAGAGGGGVGRSVGPWALWRRNLPVWAALLALVGLTWWAAYWPVGRLLNSSIALGIAGVKTALVAALFMQLRRSSALVRLAAGAGLFWLLILFGLTFSDVLARLAGR